MNISFNNKKVLFITTKNLDYLRNTQEISLIESEAASLDIIGSDKKSYVKRLLKVYWKIMTTSMKKYDTVFLGFSPQLIIPVWGGKFKKNELIIDFFISVYDTMVFDRKKFRKNSLMGRFSKWVDEKTIRKADGVICDTNAHGDYFSKEFGVDRDKIETLYLEADTSIYYPMKVEKAKEVKDRYTVLYFGSVLPLQGLHIILDAIAKLKDDKRFYFYIVGPVSDKYEKPEAENIKYYDWLSQKDLAKKIAEADLCLAGHFNKDINKAKRTIPGKAYIYRAMNKPMILGDNKATHELYSESDEGIYFVKMGDSTALRDKILEIYENNKKCK